MYYYEYINKIKANENGVDIYELMNQACDDKQVTDEEWDEIEEVFIEETTKGM